MVPNSHVLQGHTMWLGGEGGEGELQLAVAISRHCRGN